jgi:STE24 endopeptidase
LTLRRAAWATLLLALAGGWAAGGYFLWESRVPDGLRTSGLDVHRYFSGSRIAAAESYQRFNFWNQLLSMLVLLAVLAAYARWGARWMRESAAGPIGTGMLLGMLGLGLVWIADLPFTLAQLWWDRRHDLSDSGYFAYLTENWLGLAAEFLFISLALVIVMGFARLLRQRWWVAGGPFFVGLALLFAFVQPWLLLNVHRLDDPQLAAAAVALERREGAPPTPIRVQDVDDFTNQANAFATGFGPSRRIVLWNTLLDGRFSDAEVKVVLAHEIGHVARSHLWKLIGWYALFAIPGAFVIARATRRRGGMAQPAAVPLGLLVVTVLELAALPVQNLISRHVEAEADWMALEGARAPAAQRALFEELQSTSLEDPNPGFGEYALFENHPTIMQRIAMVQAWRERNRR